MLLDDELRQLLPRTGTNVHAYRLASDLHPLSAALRLSADRAHREELWLWQTVEHFRQIRDHSLHLLISRNEHSRV